MFYSPKMAYTDYKCQEKKEEVDTTQINALL